ncbi:unnamed protein product [Heligmosomoides polygyrus]|uniref:Reverse transcriptase domain-containing protein n=1 Tax=Heligmosomoides polygyrus TaxID=6339 RepID=A0A183FLS1_HELPZ|nr:unnamed protein product [Heligmosomoides polygyrus]
MGVKVDGQQLHLLNDVIIDVKRGVRQGDTISPKLFSATLENVMRELEWEDMGVKVDGQQLHHLRFADDTVLITSSISQAERMLADFDRVRKFAMSTITLPIFFPKKRTKREENDHPADNVDDTGSTRRQSTPPPPNPKKKKPTK